MEDAFIERATAPMPHGVNELVRTQYRLFKRTTIVRSKTTRTSIIH